ncbi:cyclic di-GMP phosphodiesterase [Erwinia sorbitola]|uniref:cyclic-guanylate-specific phosphodiesterase n=1 Tax=Erwinia sorbitola TaxID=2681984 RepID=A0A6I6EEB5_9GAMM|nr:cyclic di-GMP phosphodiesterase [Erwinia sorbitola]QGU86928.1 cyclic di-GMP phosphodiesterase [Erwinia sorbitola]
MPLSTTVRRQVTQPRKIVLLSASIGLFFFLLFVVIMLTVTSNRRSAAHDRLASYTQRYVANVFGDLNTTLQPLQSATEQSCELIRNDLTQRSAFASNVRAILLVKDHSAFCSSATGPMQLDISKISPFTDVRNTKDIRLISGTPMVRGQPAIVLWLKNPTHPDSGIFTTLNINLTPYLLLASREQQISGMAMVAGDSAITTWNTQVINSSLLPKQPLRSITIPGYPLTLNMYGETLPRRDITVILLAGLLMGVMITCGCFLMFTLRLRPGKEILLGIKRGEFHVEYQPVIEAHNGKPCGFEALLRWTHPIEGRIPPDSFISYAEGQNLIAPLTRHLFTLVAQDAQRLCKVVPAGARLGINLSPNHLVDPSFRQDVLDWLEMMPAGHFEYIFEITERAMVSDHNADAIFDWIRNQNIRIAIDDFGTGHSALIYLEKFQFDYLKIDRGFVQSIGMETVNSPVLDTVLTLAKKLHLNTVAEGVETAEQALWLINRGVSHLQGYLFSRPLAVPQLINFYLEQFPAGSACTPGNNMSVKSGKNL